MAARRQRSAMRSRAAFPFEYGIIRNHYVGRTFIEPTQQIRAFGVKLKHSANRAMIEGKRVVLVDDSIVRGTTSLKIVQMIRDAGAKEVHIRVASPMIFYPDFYGIDTPDADKLLANQYPASRPWRNSSAPTRSPSCRSTGSTSAVGGKAAQSGQSAVHRPLFHRRLSDASARQGTAMRWAARKVGARQQRLSSRAGPAGLRQRFRRKRDCLLLKQGDPEHAIRLKPDMLARAIQEIRSHHDHRPQGPHRARHRRLARHRLFHRDRTGQGRRPCDCLRPHRRRAGRP